MSDYSNTYGGAAKDSANSIILAADIDTQLDAVEVAVATKLDTADVQNASIGTPVTTTSGTTASFTGIPSWATQIDITLANVSITGSGSIELTIGDSGGLETSGYYTSAGGATKGATGYILANIAFSSSWTLNEITSGSEVYNGRVVITLGDPATNVWGLSSRLQSFDRIQFTDGHKALTETLTQVQLLCNSGTFDNGTIYIRYS